MKILMVTRETQSDKRYGLGRSIAPLIDEFRRRGVTVDYICQDKIGPRALLWQWRLHRLSSFLFSRCAAVTDFTALSHVVLERLNMGRIAAKFAAKHKHTHVHCHDAIIASSFRFFFRFHLGHKIRWGITSHGFSCLARGFNESGFRIGARTAQWIRKWEARTLRAASWVIYPTSSTMEQVALELNIHPMPMTWQYIHHARPVLNRYGKEKARQLLNWKNDIFYVLGVGYIAPVKQFQLLVEACAQLKNNINVQLVILGEGDHVKLSTLGRQLGLEREILFEGTDDVGLYLDAADLYVSTSASESFGLANLEAMVAGVAMVCTAVGGVPEVVANGAILVPPELDAITNAVQHLLDDSALRKTVAQNALARAQTWPDIVETADKYETIYRQMEAVRD